MRENDQDFISLWLRDKYDLIYNLGWETVYTCKYQNHSLYKQVL